LRVTVPPATNFPGIIIGMDNGSPACHAASIFSQIQRLPEKETFRIRKQRFLGLFGWASLLACSLLLLSVAGAYGAPDSGYKVIRRLTMSSL
jgi:hypothetical protein